VLRFAEEILLLALDEKTGRLHPLPERALEFALAGAVLMELAFLGRLDTDATQLMVLDTSSTGDVVLDEALKALPKTEPNLTIQKALARVALKAELLQKMLFDSLVRKGVLAKHEQKFLWMLSERRYPVVDNREEREVRGRIRDVVLSPEMIPDPRDVVLIGLMDACDLSHVVFLPEELEKASDRIKQISRMDFIVQAIAKDIGEIQQAILEVIAYSGM
jgi:hypothetical protein